MLQLTRSTLAPLTAEARQRWSRTIGALSEGVWLKIYDSHVILIGCGRNGTLLAWQLASLGVSRLTLIDGDALGLENLDAMPGLEAADVGRPKVEALGRRLVALRPDISIRCLAQPVAEVVDRLSTRADLVATCVDDDAARLAASWLAREMLAPHLDIATTVKRPASDEPHIAGDVRLLLPGEGCVVCVGGLADADNCLYELAAPPGCLHRGAPTLWTEQRAGSLVTIDSAATALGCQIWVGLLAGSFRNSQWHRLEWNAVSGVTTDQASVGADVKCRYCM
jgi:hypothetical protein